MYSDCSLSCSHWPFTTYSFWKVDERLGIMRSISSGYNMWSLVCSAMVNDIRYTLFVIGVKPNLWLVDRYQWFTVSFVWHFSLYSLYCQLYPATVEFLCSSLTLLLFLPSSWTPLFNTVCLQSIFTVVMEEIPTEEHRFQAIYTNLGYMIALMNIKLGKLTNINIIIYLVSCQKGGYS